MRRRDFPITLFILSSIGLHSLADFIPPHSPPSFPMILDIHDTESRLAIGLRASFSSVDFSDLMLIPGISDTLAERLLKGRPTILKEIRYYHPRERYRALTIIHGIGNTTAEKLSRYLEFSQRPVRRTTSMFLPLTVGSPPSGDKKMVPVSRAKSASDRSGHSIRRSTDTSGG